MGRKSNYSNGPKSPRAQSRYFGAKLISNPNIVGKSYNYSMSMASEYGPRMKAIEMAGPARKIALKKILNKKI